MVDGAMNAPVHILFTDAEALFILEAAAAGANTEEIAALLARAGRGVVAVEAIELFLEEDARNFPQEPLRDNRGSFD